MVFLQHALGMAVSWVFFHRLLYCKEKPEKKQTALKNTGKKNAPNKVKKLCVKEALKESFPDLCAPGHNTPLSVGSDVIILWVHIYSLSLTLKRDFLF